MKPSTRLKKYLEVFANQEDTICKLDKLCEFARDRKSCGFEKWLQFELLLFFQEQKKVKGEVEKKASPDGRSSNKTHFQTDIVVTMKSNETLGIELKARIKATAAIQELQKDLAKYSRTKKKYKSTSNFVVVLCAEHIDEKSRIELNREWGKILSEFHIINVGTAHLFMAEYTNN